MSQAEIDLRNQIAMDLYIKFSDYGDTSNTRIYAAQDAYKHADAFIEEMRHQMAAIKEKNVGIDPVSNQAKNHAVVGLPFGNINLADNPKNK